MVTEAREDSENFWKVQADDTEFWDAYIATRPNYSPGFYNLIYDHHAAHSSSWDTAHDVGCGGGQVTAELTRRFQHVVASDINDSHIAVAQQRVEAEVSDSRRVSYRHSNGEDLYKHYPHHSADLVAVAECLVLMDDQEGLRSFGRFLKPGGTLAAWFYGRPTFSDRNLLEKYQPLIDEIMIRNWSKVIQGSGPQRKWGFKRCADGMESWLDYISFDPNLWSDVTRVKWNTHGTLPFFGEAACGFPVEPTSNVKDGEKVIVNTDPGFWKNSWNIAMLKEYFRVLFPGFRGAIGQGDSEIDRLFNDLAEGMGGQTAVRQFTWPAVLILATRR